MTAAPAYQHKGIAIAFDTTRATFTAEVLGKTIRAPSLGAIKKKIDVLASFTAFDCYIQLTGWDAPTIEKGAIAHIPGEHCGARSLVPGIVFGVEKELSAGRSAPQFRVKFADTKGKELERQEAKVLPATKEAADAWVAHWTACEAAMDAEKTLKNNNRDMLTPLREAMPFKSPEV